MAGTECIASISAGDDVVYGRLHFFPAVVFIRSRRGSWGWCSRGEKLIALNCVRKRLKNKPAVTTRGHTVALQLDGQVTLRHAISDNGGDDQKDDHAKDSCDVAPREDDLRVLNSAEGACARDVSRPRGGGLGELA